MDEPCFTHVIMFAFYELCCLLFFFPAKSWFRSISERGCFTWLRPCRLCTCRRKRHRLSRLAKVRPWTRVLIKKDQTSELDQKARQSSELDHNPRSTDLRTGKFQNHNKKILRQVKVATELCSFDLLKFMINTWTILTITITAFSS